MAPVTWSWKRVEASGIPRGSLCSVFTDSPSSLSCAARRVVPLLLASSCLLAEARSFPGTVASSSGTVQLCSKNQTITRSPTPWPSRRKAAETSLPALDLGRNQPVFSTTRKFIIQHYSFFFFFSFHACMHSACQINRFLHFPPRNSFWTCGERLTKPTIL